MSASQPGHLDVIGNTFDMPAGNTALFLLFPQKSRVWFNTVNGLSAAAGASPTTRAMADVRFNQLGGIAWFEGGLFAGAAKFLGHRLGASDPGFGDPTVLPGRNHPRCRHRNRGPNSRTSRHEPGHRRSHRLRSGHEHGHRSGHGHEHTHQPGRCRR